MSQLLERIKNDVEMLPTGEQFDLYETLRSRFAPALEEDSVSCDDAWEIEIAQRVQDIKNGELQPLPGPVADEKMKDFIRELRASKDRASA